MDDAACRPWAIVLSSDVVGLGAVRSLHAGGVPTIVVMLDPLEPVRASRYGHKVLVPKSPDVEGALLDVLTGLEREPRPVLIPTSDHLVHFVASIGPAWKDTSSAAFPRRPRSRSHSTRPRTRNSCRA